MNLVILPKHSRTDVALESLKWRIGRACLLQHFQEKPAQALSTPQVNPLSDRREWTNQKHLYCFVLKPVRSTFIVFYWSQSETVLLQGSSELFPPWPSCVEELWGRDWKNVSLHLWRPRDWTHISFWQENRIYSKDISRGCDIRLKWKKVKRPTSAWNRK